MVTAVSESPDSRTWFLDTGCTNHMCGKKELFAELDESFGTKVKFADDSAIPVTGKGQIPDTNEGAHSSSAQEMSLPQILAESGRPRRQH